MKKVLALLLVMVLCVFFASCANTNTGTNEDGEKPQEETTAYFISIMSGGAAWSQAERGFYAACEELGITGYYLAPVEVANSTEMASLLDMAVLEGGDILVGTYISVDMFGPSLLKAKENGAVTVSVNLVLDEQYCDFEVGTDNNNMGIARAEALIEMYEKHGETLYYVIGRNSASEWSNAADAAMEAHLAERGYDGEDQIVRLDEVFDDNSAVTAAERFADYYKLYPQLNCIVCENSSASTMGAANFVQENGLEDEFVVIGIDASADILNYILEDAIDCTVNQDFYNMGYMSVMMGYDLWANGKAPENFMNDSGCYLIHKDEVEAYAAEAGLDLG